MHAWGEEESERAHNLFEIMQLLKNGSCLLNPMKLLKPHISFGFTCLLPHMQYLKNRSMDFASDFSLQIQKLILIFPGLISSLSTLKYTYFHKITKVAEQRK